MSTALKEAIEANDPEAVGKALKGVKDLNRKLPGAKAPLVHASEKGAVKVLEALVKAGAVAEKKNTFPGDTPFAVAAEHKQFEVMKELLRLKQASIEAVDHVWHDAAMRGKPDVLEFVLASVKPEITIGWFRLATIPANGADQLKLLLKYGGDIKGRYETDDAPNATLLHDLVGRANVPIIRALVECGAEVNARDGLGRTPLMDLMATMQRIIGQNDEVPEAVRTLLELGADASITDDAGNDAIDYCVFEYLRYNQASPPGVIKVLREAGAKGSQPTHELMWALRKSDLEAAKAAIKNGADVNRVTPPPVPTTPLINATIAKANAVELVRALLKAGADPNKRAKSTTPLIRAAGSGNLEVVKELLAAGANLHTVSVVGEYIENAYSASERNDEIHAYLKSIGAKNPTRPEVLKAGVESWNDFSEVLVNATVEKAAEGLAKMIGGKVQLNVYGQAFSPGKRAYVVARPKGMAWCNVFQVAPAPQRFEEPEKTLAFATELANACDAPALMIDYSDTSDAASVVRVTATGEKTEDQGWDRETLEEMVEAMGDEAPAWAKRQLAETDEEDPSSTERLVALAEHEKFVVAAFGFYAEPGKKIEIEVTGYGSETFDGVAFVSN